MPPLQPERRQLLKAGAVMWAVPVVAVATAAPAYATSGSNMSTSRGTMVRIRGNPQPLTINLSLTNSGSGSTTTLKVAFTVDGIQTTGHVYPIGIWSAPVVVAETITFTYLGTQMGAGQSIVAGPFVLNRGSTTGKAAVPVTVDPGGGGIPGTFTTED